MSLRGELSTLSVPEMLQFLGSNHRTGVLVLENAGQRKELILQGGAIAFCTAGRPKERLGHHVLSRTSVTESDLDIAFRKQDLTGQRLGELLVGDGRMRELELATVLRSKLEDSVHDLFTWSLGTFEWRETAAAPEVPVHLDLPWQEALLGGGERADETGSALAQLGGRGSLLGVANWKAVLDSSLGARDGELVRLASQGLTVEEVCSIRHETDFELLTALSHLVREGLLAVRRGRAERDEPLAPTQGLSFARALIDRGHLLEAMDTLFDLARRYPVHADVCLTLRAAESLVRLRLERELGGLGSVPRRTNDEAIATTSLSARGRAVLERVNGSWPLASLVRICPLGELETLLVVRALFRQGLLGLIAPGQSEALPAAAPAPKSLPATAPKTPSRLALEPGPGGRGSRRIGLLDEDRSLPTKG